MATRLEYKFLVPIDRLDSIRAEVRPYVELDPYAARSESQEYTVRSVYYDTPGNDCYADKIEGVRARRKFRIRGYNRLSRDSVAFLEIKRKCVNLIEKNRAPLLEQDLTDLFGTRDLDRYIISRNGNGLEKREAGRFLYHYYRRGLHPTVLVIFDREAFYGRFDRSFRLTFDKNLRNVPSPSLDMLSDGQQAAPVLRGHFILEVKFSGGLPAWILSVLRRYQLSRMALSKYTICLDAHSRPGRIATRSQSGWII